MIFAYLKVSLLLNLRTMLDIKLMLNSLIIDLIVPSTTKGDAVPIGDGCPMAQSL